MDDFPVMDLFSQFATVDGLSVDRVSVDSAPVDGVSPDRMPPDGVSLGLEHEMPDSAEPSVFPASQPMESDLRLLLTDLQGMVHQLFDFPLDATPPSTS